MAGGWRDDESDRLTELHDAGRSLHSIAEELGRSKQTIGRHAERLGLSFDRTQTAKAAEANHVDNKARRAAAETRLLDIVNATLDKLDGPARVYSFGGADNRFTEEWFDDGPPPNDRKALIQAAATALTSANKLHELNSGRDVDDARASLTLLREAMRGAAGE